MVDPSTGTLVRDRASVVVCVVDGRPIPALLPASLAVNLGQLLKLTGAGEIRLAGEGEAAGPFSAEPIFVDVRLAWSHEIVFTMDAAPEAVVMQWADFARTVRPIVGNFAEPRQDRVGAHRLSYRE
jgi:hypothetical protein